jgi:hypothetical protein
MLIDIIFSLYSSYYLFRSLINFLIICKFNFKQYITHYFKKISNFKIVETLKKLVKT